MRRGEVVVIADRSGDFTGKPRPAVIIQSDLFDGGQTIIVCPLTSRRDDAQIIRLPVEPSPKLRLAATSWMMVDKISSVRRDRVGQSVGVLASSELTALNRSLAVFLGLA